MSYNSLFGLGSHSEDASLEGWWKLQDDAASTTVVDSSSNGNDATLNGGDTTSGVSTTGPTGYLGSAFGLDGSLDWLNAPSVGPYTNFTLLSWVNLAAAPASGHHAMILGFTNASTGTSNQWSGVLGVTDASKLCGYVFDGAGKKAESTASLSGWDHVSAVFESGSAITNYINGVSDGSVTIGTPFTGFSSGPDLRTSGLTTNFGTDFERRLSASVAENVFFSRTLSSSEVAEVYNGPEPLNTVVPTLSFGASTWTGGVGSWDSQLNGTVTFTWQLRRASDNGVEQSGVGASPSGPNPADGDYYLWVRASNDGGYDSAEDSVSATETLSGGGPGGFQPWFARPSARLIGGGVA